MQLSPQEYWGVGTLSHGSRGDYQTEGDDGAKLCVQAVAAHLVSLSAKKGTTLCHIASKTLFAVFQL